VTGSPSVLPGRWCHELSVNVGPTVPHVVRAFDPVQRLVDGKFLAHFHDLCHSRTVNQCLFHLDPLPSDVFVNDHNAWRSRAAGLRASRTDTVCTGTAAAVIRASIAIVGASGDG
jgi:hypothetical protein